VYTNQKSLRYWLEQHITIQNQQSWLAKLMRYEFDIVYKSGKTNKLVDALSRVVDDIDKEEIDLVVIYRRYQ